MAQQINNLVGWFKLDGNVTDSADSPTNGSWSGAATYGTGKQFTNAGDFEGSNRVTSAASLTVQSVSFWMELDANNTDLLDLTTTAKVSIDGSDEITTANLSGVTIYVDNTADATAATGVYKLVVVTFDSITADAIIIGEGTNGRIGDVRLYNQSLTEQERFSLWSGGDGNQFNDFTRILYEVTGTTSFDVASNSDLDFNTDDEIDSHVFTVQSPYPVEIGDALNFYDYNSVKQVSGSVRDIGVNPLTKLVTVYNWEILMKDKLVNQVFESLSPEALIEQVVEANTDLVYSSTYASGLTIARYTARNKTVRQVVIDMLKQLPGVTYRVTNEKLLEIYSLGATTSTQTLTNGANVNINGGWGQDSAKQVTRLTLIGETQTPELVETFNGTGAQTAYTLQEIPTTIKVEYDSGSGFVEQTLTVEGQTSGDYTLNPDTKKITFAAAPATGTDNIRVTYNFTLNITVEQDSDITTQAKYGIIEDEITRKFITDMNGARNYATEYLSRFSVPLLSTDIIKGDNLDLTGLVPGQQIKVVDTINEIDGANIDGFFIIRKITRNWAAGSLIIEVGSEPSGAISFFQEASYNLQQLYEQDNNSTFFQKSQQFVNNMSIQFDSDVTAIEKRTFAADTFYLEDDGSGTRNQMLNDGSGPVMRETGYTPVDVDGTGDDRIIQVTGDLRVTQAGDQRITNSVTDTNLDIGIITTSYQTSALANFLADVLGDVTYMAVGDGTSTPLVTQTALDNETDIDAIFQSATGGNFVSWDLKLDITENNGNTINEIGTFTAASSGTMYTRNLTTSFAKTANNEVYYQVKLVVGTEVTDLG